MKRHFVLAAVWTAISAYGALAATNDLIPETTANRHGLTRPWMAQVDVDAARGRVRDVVLDRGTLFVQTDRAGIHAFDAETGQTLWSKQVGRVDHPSMTPGLSDKLLVSINGSRLYALNRYTGELLYETEIKGAAGAGPGVSNMRAYVPMVNGLVLAYRLEPLTDAKKELGVSRHNESDETSAKETSYENLRLRQEYVPPLACQSDGRALVQPLVTRDTDYEENCVWPTDKGYINIGYVDKRATSESLAIRYRKGGVGVEGRPDYQPNPQPNKAGMILAGGRDGFVYAINEKTGDEYWRFSTGEPIVQPVFRVDDRVYATTQFGGLHCLAIKPKTTSGEEIWFAPQIMRFLAASKDRVYAVDHLERFVILNAANGARMETMPAGDLAFAVSNPDTDRVYLVSKTGLVQCLHEVELAEPLKHNPVAVKEKPAKGTKGPKTDEDAVDEDAPKPAKKEAKPKSDTQPRPKRDVEPRPKKVVEPKAKPEPKPKKIVEPKVKPEPKAKPEPKPKRGKKTTDPFDTAPAAGTF